MVQIKLLSENAKVPTKAHPGDAGFDLYTPRDFVLKPGCQELIDLEITITDFPSNTYARIAPRSSLAMKGVDVLAGVIDSNYQGNVGVILSLSSNSSEISFETGLKIAQLIFEKYEPNAFFEIVNDFSVQTDRNTGGFGSTGV